MYVAAITILLVMIVPVSAQGTQGIVINVTYPYGYTPSNVTELLLPATLNATYVARGYGCATPIPSIVLQVDGYLVALFRDLTSHAAGASALYTVCSGSASHQTPFPAARLVDVEATCTGTESRTTATNSGTDTVSVTLVYPQNSTVLNVVVSVLAYAYYAPYTVYVYVCPAGYECYEYTYASDVIVTSFSTAFYGPWDTSTITVYVNASGPSLVYSYFVVTVGSDYLAPTRNETSVNVTGGDIYYVLYGGGPGWITSGTVTIDIEGSGWALITPQLSAVNGELIEHGTPSDNLTITAWCYGANVTTRIVAMVFYGNSTVASYEPVAVVYEAAQPSTTINANLSLSVSLNTSGLESTISTAVNETVGFAATALSSLSAVTSIVLTLVSLAAPYPYSTLALYAAPWFIIASVLLAADAPLVVHAVPVVAMIFWLVVWIWKMLRGD